MVQRAANVDHEAEESSRGITKRFKLLVQLGAGGMALVHLAVARGAAGADKLVVLKSIRPEFVDNDKVLSMFADEARLAVQMSHPNVVQTYEVVTFGSLPVIVMEYLEGQSYMKCQETCMPMNLRLHVLAEILSGLDYAHSMKALDGTPLGTVHRDVSPQNVIVTYDGHVKVLDFGIAKAMGHHAHTETGEMKGKIRYMAPEQMNGRGAIDRRADLFAVGVMLWEALTETRVWAQLSGVEIIQTLLESGLPRPSTVRDGIPPALEEVCMKAVADAPEARYATAAEMLDALNRSVDAVSYRLAARDLASWMAGTFSERQERMRSLVRTQLEQTSSKLIAVRGDSDELVPAADLSELRSSSSPQPVAHTRIRTRDLRTTGIVVGVALVALAVTAVVRLGVALRPTDATAVPSASVATAPASAPPAIEAVSAVPPPTGVAPEPALAEVYLSAMPHSARLFVDELEVPNPYATRRPVDSTPHTLRVEAKGFQRRILQIGPFQGRIDQTITLDPLGGGRHVVVSAPATKPHADQVAPAPSKAADCDSHFYRDANGILRVKPECVE